MRRVDTGHGLAALAVALTFGAGVAAGATEPPARLLVLGIDGMDPSLLQQLIDAGRMPNFARLAE